MEVKETKAQLCACAIDILEEEIIYLKGEMREKAFETYHRLLLSSVNEPIYLMRSE